MNSATVVRDVSRRIVSMDPSSVAEYRWPLRGKRLPVDHGYALFGALTKVFPQVHGNGCTWQVAPISLDYRRDGQLKRTSELVIRAPWEDAPILTKLSGSRLEVDYHTLHLGKAQVHQIKPWPNITSRLVVIKSCGEPKPDEETFWASLAKQIAPLIQDPDGVAVEIGKRRIARISRYTVFGWAVSIRGLTPGDSARIMATGLGGKRHMGCGVFGPVCRH